MNETQIKLKERLFTVWVGAGEINDQLLTNEEATELKRHWNEKGYTDVVIQEVSEATK